MLTPAGAAWRTRAAPAAPPLGNYTSSSTPPPPPRQARALALGAKWALQPFARGRVAKCGRVRIADAVGLGVRSRPGGDAGELGAHFDGLVRCGSVWECASCSLAIRAERCADIEHVAGWWRDRAGGLLMLTLTVRHAWDHEVKASRRGLMKAWARVARGRPWEKWCDLAGLAGWVRSVEVTHGRNGWHPHLHVLLFVGAGAVDPAAVAQLRARLADRWADAVAAQLGEAQRPDDVHGVDLRPAHVAGYLSKVALELTAAQNKTAGAGRVGSRTPWQIAADFRAWGDDDDLQLWRRYCDGMKGARFVEWSRGRMDIRRASGLGAERSDEEIAEGSAGAEQHVCDVPADVWDARRDDVAWQLAVLRAAELRDVAQLAELIPGAVWPSVPIPLPVAVPGRTFREVWLGDAGPEVCPTASEPATW